MKHPNLVLLCGALLLACSLHAQTDLVLGRAVGQDTLFMQSGAPNILEGREFNSPQGVALDTSQSPAAIYVSDTVNNRVLGWRNSASFQNGAPADLIIGQKDKISNGANGPGVSGSNQQKGINSPTGLAVDKNGNLYVVDAGNNRILRFPTPFVTNDPFGADKVIGQPDFTTRASNQGGISATSIATVRSNSAQRATVFFDGGGNLWFTDTANNRVLRYPAAAGSGVSAEANLVLGQKDFTTNGSTSNVTVLDKFNTPTGLTLDSKGNLFVTDAIHRVLVFTPQFLNGMSAKYTIGGVLGSGPGNSVRPPTSSSLYAPQCVAATKDGKDEILVCDSGNNRVLRFPALASWSAGGKAPAASQFIGQPTIGSYTPGVGPGLMNTPVQIVTTETEFFVVDSNNNRVITYPYNQLNATRVLGQLGLNYNGVNLIEGKELNLRSGSAGIVVDTTGSTPRLYIADTGNNRVLGYCDARAAKQGKKADIVIGQPDLYQSQANGDGGTKPNDQYLWFPTGLTVDAGGNLYVADTGNGRVLRFAAPCTANQSFPHANLVLGQPDYATVNTSPNAKTLASPYGLAFTPAGNLMISDNAHHRVLRFEKGSGGDFSNGQAAAFVFGQTDFYNSGSGSATNQFNGPRQVAIDGGGRLYVADLSNNRVLVFSDADHTVAQQPSAVFSLLYAQDQSHPLRSPSGVWIDKASNAIWVAPANETRILRYPDFDTVSVSLFATTAVSTYTSPLAITEDADANVYVAEVGSRVSVYFQAATTLNGAHYLLNRAVTPGSLVSAWFPKTRSVPPANATTVPLPTQLGGIQVVVGGVPAPILFAGDVSATQIQVNFQMPFSAPSSGYADIQIQDATTQQVLGAWIATMQSADPGFFTTNSAGTGEISAQNIDISKPDGDPTRWTCNGPTAGPSGACPNGTRPAKIGEVLTLYLTGAGYQSAWPKEGNVATGAINTDGSMPQVWLGTKNLDAGNVLYSGIAPGYAGLWQINVKIPNDGSINVVTGVNPILVKYRDITSQPKTSVLIQK